MATTNNDGTRNQSLDFDLGQHALLNKLDIRWFGGLRLSRVKNAAQFAYSGASLPRSVENRIKGERVLISTELFYLLPEWLG
ncbi:hypothetical protein ACD661_15235 [Legionella lytica]|uniref:Uncharacterized protein n=1 Tax=Legionella lytica TaxID=96232 RepID=A0ABW8DCK0_9GAMM